MIRPIRSATGKVLSRPTSWLVPALMFVVVDRDAFPASQDALPSSTACPGDDATQPAPPVRTFRVAAVQQAARFGDPERNRAALKVLIERAAARGASVVVLPEAAVTGYLSPDLKRTWQVDDSPVSSGLIGVDPSASAEPVPGLSTRFFSAVAREHNLYLTVPIVEVDPTTRKYFNTVVLLDPRGEIAIHYRKLNPWPWAERGWATRGNRGLPVVDTPFGRLGVLICFDIHEQAARIAEQKIDTLLYSIAWVEDEGSTWFEKDLPQRAVAHGFNIVAANWTLPPGAGKPSWSGYGQSRVIDAAGSILARCRDDAAEDIIIADLPLPP